MKILTVNYPKLEEDLTKINFFDEKFSENLQGQVEINSKKFSELPSFKV